MTFIHTTHVGSLPRSAELAALLIKRDRGESVDEAAFDALVQSEIEKAVRAQVAAGVSIVSDGELGKVGYSTYITQRLSGFGGLVDRTPAKDLADLPDLRKKLAAIMGTQEFVRASCIDKVRLINSKPVEDDIRRFRLALDRAGKGARGFLNAASPGLITAFQPNVFYARGLSGRSRRCDATGVRGNCRSRVRPAARCARSCNGRTYRLPEP